MRIRDALALLWLVPPVAAGGMWVRSCSTMDEVSAVDEGNVLRAAVSYRGAVHFIRSEQNSTPRDLAWDTYDVPAGASWGNLYAPGDGHWRWMGFAKFAVPRAAPAAAAPGRAAPPASAPAVRVVPPQAARAIRAAAATRPAARAPLPPGRPRLIAPWLFTPRYTAYAVPYWAPLAATAVPATFVTTRLLRRTLRGRRGLCPGCGYDVRATADRCPECGEIVGGRGRGTAG